MKVNCPVCGDEIQDVPSEVKVGDRVVVVCCPECAEAVRQQPEAYRGKQ
jgi:hypothetical protein